MSKTNFSGITIDAKDIKVKVGFSRQQQAINRAQFALDERVMQDMMPFMPADTGSFIQLTEARSHAYAGSGTVCAGVAPMGRYLYEGKVMVDEEGRGATPMDIDGQIIFRFRKGAILHATDKPLTYSKHMNPNAGDHWFDKAKKQNLKDWIKATQGVLNGET